MTEDNEQEEWVLETGSKAIAAVVGAGVGGVPGALVAVALEPMFIQLAAKSWDELREARHRSAGLMMQVASGQLGGAPEDVTNRAFETEAKAQLLADALQSAVSTSNETKVRGLGRALANGLAGDEARVDEESLVIAGLASLEAPHIRALAKLPRQRSRPTTSPNSSAKGSAGRRGMRALVLAGAAGLSSEGVTSVLAELVRTGMASRDSYAADRRHDRLLIELQAEVAKLQWIIDNPTKKPSTSRRPKSLKKPGPPIELGYERTSFGDICLDYLHALPNDDQAEVADDLRAESDDS